MAEVLDHRVQPYPYLRADGVPVAHPLFQAEGGGAIPTSALHLKFEQIGIVTACQLNALWHSALPNFVVQQAKGGGKHGLCFSAEYEGGFYAAAIWSSPPALNRMNWSVDEVLELRRFAISPQAPPNTASRMLGWMAREIRRRIPSLLVLISYQAVDHHKGTIYRAAGWVPTRLSDYQPWEHHGGSRPVIAGKKVRWERALNE